MLALRNPDLFHGHGKGLNFFEGWYFKLVDASRENVLAFIPGIFFGKEPSHHHGFIQVVQAVNTKYDYLTYPADAFKADKRKFDICISGNQFSLEGMQLDIRRSEIQIGGSLSFRNVVKWPDTWINPGSMGFYNYIPNMQCYAHVCAMDMDIDGLITIDNREYDFSGGRGYVEKNWGKAFPYSWIWIQSNHFADNRASLSCSLAHIPLPIGSFRGHLIGMSVGGSFYSFTTMNGSKMKVIPRERDVSIHVENQDHIMIIDTETHREDFILLNGPRDGKMVPLVQENLAGRVGVKLVSKKNGDVIFHSVGECAGIEYGGDQMIVLDDARTRGLGQYYE